jgi:hypothetical protein
MKTEIVTNLVGKTVLLMCKGLIHEVTGGWRKLHNEELHGLYSSPSIVTVIKARRMR